MQLKDLCVLDVARCTKELSIAGAARMMRQHHTGDLVVVADDVNDPVPIGIVTDRDIVIEGLAHGCDVDKTTVGDIMSHHVVIAAAAETPTTALERMHHHGVRRMPIVDEAGNILGIVTLDDLMRLLGEQAALMGQVIAKGQAHESRVRR